MAENLARDWHIYKITNPNGRVYIGKTVNFKKRLSAYRGLDCKNQPLIYRSIQKYGIENHAFEVIDTFHSDISFANGKEIFWIRTYMTHENKWRNGIGMNMCEGGGGTLGRKKTDHEKILISLKNKGFKHTEEAKMKIAAASKGKQYCLGRKQTPEEIAKRVKALTGLKRKTTLKLSEETKNKIRIANKGVKKSSSHVLKLTEINIKKTGKSFNQYDMHDNFIASYRSRKQASVATGCNESLIKRVLHGDSKHTGGFIFKYI